MQLLKTRKNAFRCALDMYCCNGACYALRPGLNIGDKGPLVLMLCKWCNMKGPNTGKLKKKQFMYHYNNTKTPRHFSPTIYSDLLKKNFILKTFFSIPVFCDKFVKNYSRNIRFNKRGSKCKIRTSLMANLKFARESTFLSIYFSVFLLNLYSF